MPGKRNDSLQPELTGTASTVARRFTMFDSKKRWIFVAALAVPALVGLGLIGASMSAKSKAADAANAASSASAEAPPESSVATPAGSIEIVPSGPATAVVTTGGTQASPENDLPAGAAPPTGTLLGASPVPPSAANGGNASTKPRPATYSPPAPKPAAPQTTAMAPTGAKKPPPTSGTSRPALPPGLPLTRQ
jgi:hypothetical protein